MFYAKLLVLALMTVLRLVWNFLLVVAVCLCLIYLAQLCGLIKPAAASDGWAFWSSQGWEEVQPEAMYRLNVAGWDTRVYEWTLKSAPNVHCVAQFSNSAVVGMQCVEIKE